MSLNVNNTEVLDNYIGELQTLLEEWASTKDEPPEIGENGGSTIIQIEEMSNMFGRMQEGFVLLLEQTIAYMTNRKESIDTKEQHATDTVNEIESAAK